MVKQSGGKPGSTKTPGGYADVPHGIAADRRLKATDCRVIMALLFHACDRSECECSDEQLAKYAQVHERTITRSLDSLEGLGLI
ncbi:helix-turn-helix domain-containing protein [Singulisphaera sp. Ch08]|uniref:Helix-turn-helix domain-containing protein n=1 Tax=Singulisphaera sp. Ch08 TaxID=3120278 RepID=A0AAU7CRK7_9BACT